MKYNELKRILLKNGCILEREKTRHEWWYSPITNERFTIGRHGTLEVPKGTLKSISKQSGVKI